MPLDRSIQRVARHSLRSRNTRDARPISARSTKKSRSAISRSARFPYSILVQTGPLNGTAATPAAASASMTAPISVTSARLCATLLRQYCWIPIVAPAPERRLRPAIPFAGR